MIRRIKIYTTKGDKGYTSIKYKKIKKNSETIQLLSYIDDLQTAIGFLLFNINNDPEYFIIKNIQKELFRLSSVIAGYQVLFDTNLYKDLEKRIDEIDSTLPRLKNFIIAGLSTNELELYAHQCRTKTRIVETHIYESIGDDIKTFFNRLSDYFFILVRKYNTNETAYYIKKDVFKSTKS